MVVSSQKDRPTYNTVTQAVLIGLFQNKDNGVHVSLFAALVQTEYCSVSLIWTCRSFVKFFQPRILQCPFSFTYTLSVC